MIQICDVTESCMNRVYLFNSVENVAFKNAILMNQ